MQLQRQKLDTYAISISTFLQHAHFQREAYAELFIEVLFRYRDQGKFQLHGFAVMPNHVHLLLTPNTGVSTAKSVQFLKGGYSFEMRKLSPKEIWHSGHHEHRVRDLVDYDNQLRYIANNPPPNHLPPEYPFVHTHPRFTNLLDPHSPDILS